MTNPPGGERFDPMRSLNNLRDSVSRLIEDGLNNLNAANSVISIDVYETETAVVVKAGPMWGIDIDKIDVSITGDSLTLKGETRREEDVPAEAYLRRERRFGEFARSIKIPRPIRPDQATADLKQATLIITIPKEANPEPKIVNVRSAGE